MTRLYYPPNSELRDLWEGRVDHRENFKSFRWHQWVEFIDLNQDLNKITGAKKGICFLGFKCDKGVVKNKGRAGASQGPSSIRKEMANFPCRFDKSFKLYDAGDVISYDHSLAETQKALAQMVEKIKKLNLFPVLLGGGHEIAFGHYQGLLNSLSSKEGVRESAPGIINFDAHFDLRPYPDGGNSGTMFRQIADQCQEKGYDFSYFCLGIQKSANTISLFEKADELGVEYVLAKDINSFNLINILESLDKFIFEQDHIYFTICTDVFSSAYAPGVSAAHPLGIEPEIGLKLIKHIIKSNKVISFDIAEVSPRFDMDNVTSYLAAIIIFAIIDTIVGNE